MQQGWSKPSGKLDAFRPVGERLDKTLLFVERAKKRLASAEEVLMNAIQVKSTRERELQDGLDRMKRLREEAAAQTAAAPPEPDEELNQLRNRVVEL